MDPRAEPQALTDAWRHGGPAYPAARAVASKVREHFDRHLALSPEGGRPSVVSVPDADVIETVIDAAFWASLRREEGYVPRISLAILAPEQAVAPLMFGRPLPLLPSTLAQVAPAVERPGIHLAVSRIQGELRVWGTIRTVPTFCVVLEVAAPGLLVIKHRRNEDSGKFVNVAVIEGDQIKVVKKQASTLPDWFSLLTSFVGFDVPSWFGSVNVLVELAVSMRAHGRGGSLLFVAAGREGWRESIVHPIAYAVAPPFAELADLMRQPPGEKRQDCQEALGRAVEVIAGLTAVDGATVLTNQYELLAFGAKIVRRGAAELVERVIVTEPIEGGEVAVVHPVQLGGTRHLSAAQFVQDERDAIALVASQDGRFTVFAWSAREAMVHAHRVETLLL